MANLFICGGKTEKFGIQSGVSIRHLHDPHRLNEPRVNNETGVRSYKYSALRLYTNLRKSTKESDNV